MNAAQRIIAKFGGQTALALSLSRKQSTVQYWSKTGNIPAKWHADIMTVAAERGISLSPSEFDPAAAAQTVVLGPPLARWQGFLPIAGGGLPVYVLHDGRSVITQADARDFLTGERNGYKLESHLCALELQPFLPTEVGDQFFDITIPEVEENVEAMPTSAFIDICSAFSRAGDAGALASELQRKMAARASTVLAPFAKTGIEAATHEVSGYEFEWAPDALRAKLSLYDEEEMQRWEKMFPDELWAQFGRLTNCKGTISFRPKFWGKLVNELIYGYLDGDVMRWLKTNSPSPRHGQNYHEWISSQFGLKRLVEHVWMVIGLATACRDMTELRERMAERFGRKRVQFTLYLPSKGGHCR
jgi:hypothetical protein